MKPLRRERKTGRPRRRTALWILAALLPLGLLIGLWSREGQSEGIRKDPVFLGPPGSPPWYKVEPEAIPDYLLWREFLGAVVRHGKYGNRSFTLFLGDKVGLEEADAIRVWEVAKEFDKWRRDPMEGGDEAQVAQAVQRCKRAYFALQDELSPEVFDLIEDFLDFEFRYSFTTLEKDSDLERRVSAIHHSFSELTRKEVGAKEHPGGRGE